MNKLDEDSFTKKGQYYIHVDCQNNSEEEKAETKVEAKSEKEEMVKCTLCKEDLPEDEVIKRGSFKVHEACLELYRSQKLDVEVKTRQLRTCPKCKEKLNPLDENAVDMGTATYHKTCYEKIQREQENRDNLYNYISVLYDIEFPTGFMMRQIAEYYGKRGYSYKGMLVTLKYIYEVERLPVLKGTGVGLISSYYERAKVYYKKIHLAGESAQTVAIDNTPRKIKVFKENNNMKKKKYNLSDY